MSIIPTFRDFVAEADVPLDDNLSDVEKVDVLWAVYDQHVWTLVETIRNDPGHGLNPTQVLNSLADDIISTHLGEEWYQRNIIGSARSRQSKAFLPFDGPPLARLLAMQRTHDLARRLYQLQSFDWFDRIVTATSTKDLSGVSFELDVLWLLHLIAGPVEARAEIGGKGQNYDIAVRVMGMEDSVPVEVKTKDDDTTFTQRTVASTLKGAAQQMPKNTRGIVFLRIPPAWVGTRLEDEYTDALIDGTRQTSRVAAVVSAVDKPTFTEGTRGHVTRHFHYFKVPDCPDPIWDYLLMLKQLWDNDMTQWAPQPPF